jgi:hypothetical protein
MPLLTDDLRSRLPPLLSQEAEGDPMVYALCCAQHKACWTKPLRGIRAVPEFQRKDPALVNQAPPFL